MGFEPASNASALCKSHYNSTTNGRDVCVEHVKEHAVTVYTHMYVNACRVITIQTSCSNDIHIQIA